MPKEAIEMTGRRLKTIMRQWGIPVLLAGFFLGGCTGIRLISDYDEVIDRGTIEFAEQFNTHVRNMGDLAGTQQGTFRNNRQTYNALESKLDVLIARASAASEGKGCKLENKVFDRISALFQNRIPAGMQPGDVGNAEGCNARLLTLVKEQLLLVKTIHKETDKCGAQHLSCLRPATAKTALEIANQSINAVSIVEAAKKQ
jgi:hypothetical protein